MVIAPVELFDVETKFLPQLLTTFNGKDAILVKMTSHVQRGNLHGTLILVAVGDVKQHVVELAMQ